MTPEAQRIAIAKSQGHSGIHWQQGQLLSKWGSLKYYDPVPEYLKDRNAMHHAVESLTEGEFSDYHTELLRTANDVSRYKLDRDMLLPSLERMAKAYLKAKGLWTT